jgi:hypothetical protein
MIGRCDPAYDSERVEGVDVTEFTGNPPYSVPPY